MNAERDSLTVIKVGGSLLDLPELGLGLRCWLAEHSASRNLLVPGGGPLADAIRTYHRAHQLQEEQSHWLAIRTMQINAVLLHHLLGDAPIIDHPLDMPEKGIAILDAFSFCCGDDDNVDALPHSWQVTSDSIAARVAIAGNAASLVMLKSVDLQAPYDWEQVAEAGGVDHAFGSVVSQGRFEVQWINFRKLIPDRE